MPAPLARIASGDNPKPAKFRIPDPTTLLPNNCASGPRAASLNSAIIFPNASFHPVNNSPAAEINPLSPEAISSKNFIPESTPPAVKVAAAAVIAFS